MEPIRVLHVVSSLGISDGVASDTMNYYHAIDSKLVIQDFVLLIDEQPNYYDQLHSQYFVLNVNQKSRFQFTKDVKDFLSKHHDYDMIHLHILKFTLTFAYYAKKYGIKHRIIHSHASYAGGNPIRKIYEKATRNYSLKYGTSYLACSDNAGRFLFKNRPYTKITNAIDAKRFIFNQKIRDQIRDQYQWQNHKIVLSIGRLSQEKNHSFLIDMMNELIKKDDTYKLIIIGHGPLKNELLSKIKENHLNEYVSILPPSDHIEQYYQAADLFVFPSFAEGFGLVLAEAQCSGLPCIASTGVPDETNIGGNVIYYDLALGSKEWARLVDQVINEPKSREIDLTAITSCNYEITTASKQLLDYYIQIKNKKKKS